MGFKYSIWLDSENLRLGSDSPIYEVLEQGVVDRKLCHKFALGFMDFFNTLHEEGYFHTNRLFGRVSLSSSHKCPNAYIVDAELLGKSLGSKDIFQSSIEFSYSPENSHFIVSNGAKSYIKNILLALKNKLPIDSFDHARDLNYKIIFQREPCLLENNYTKNLDFCSMDDDIAYNSFIMKHKNDKIIIVQTIGGFRISQRGDFHCPVQFGVVIENSKVKGYLSNIVFSKIFIN